MLNENIINNLVKIAKNYIKNGYKNHDEYYKEWTEELSKIDKEDRAIVVFQVGDIVMEEIKMKYPSQAMG